MRTVVSDVPEMAAACRLNFALTGASATLRPYNPQTGFDPRRPPRPIRNCLSPWRRRHGRGLSGARHRSCTARSRSKSCPRRSPTIPDVSPAFSAKRTSWRRSIIRTSPRSTASRNRPARRRRSWSWSWSRARTVASGSRAAPMPLDEALPIAKQIAEALEAAHEQGDHPPRSQARQHQGPARRHREGARLRFGEGDGTRRRPHGERRRSRRPSRHRR